MEKPSAAKSSKIKLLKFIPKAASVIKFQNFPFSPGRTKKATKVENYSADNENPSQILSISPSPSEKSSSFHAEPISPKVSCMGQVKLRKKCFKSNLFLIPNEINTSYSSPFVSKHNPSVMEPVLFLPDAKKKLLNCRKPGKKSDIIHSGKRCSLVDRAASLSQMARFSSCRGQPFVDFDWINSQIEADRDLDEWKCYYSEGEEKEKVVVPFFAIAPICAVGEGGGEAIEPKKEINLWKRRTICQPKALQIYS